MHLKDNLQSENLDSIENLDFQMNNHYDESDN